MAFLVSSFPELKGVCACPPESYQLLSGQRGITPAFGYGAPHPGARGTLTLLNNVLLSTQDANVRPHLFSPRTMDRTSAVNRFSIAVGSVTG